MLCKHCFTEEEFAGDSAKIKHLTYTVGPLSQFMTL